MLKSKGYPIVYPQYNLCVAACMKCFVLMSQKVSYCFICRWSSEGTTEHLWSL